MKQKFRLFKTLLFCGFLALSSCQDDTADNANEALENQVNHDYLNFERFSELFPKYAKRVTNKNKKSKEDASRGVYDSINDFTILTDKIFMAENEGGTYVTFGVLKASQNAEGLDNLVLKLDINGGFKPILVHYDLSEEEKTLLITEERFPDLANKLTYKFLDAVDLTLLGGNAKQQCVTFMVGYCEYGNHAHGMENGERCPGYQEKEQTTCSAGSGNGGGGGGGSGGGGNPGTGTYNPNLPVITTPIFEAGQAISPCTKISNLFSSNPTMKAALESLALKTSESTEWGNYKVTSSSIIQTAPSTASGAVDFPSAIDGKYVMIAHTHNSPASSTYSVFSWEDLIGMAQLIRKGKIDTDQFVAFLITADGTRYALTIDDPYVFIKFFAKIHDSDYDEQLSLRIGSEAIKYYFVKDPGVPLIKENSADNLKDEKAFLDMLNDNSMGVSLFEVDATFTTFEKVTHNKTTDNIDKQPCN